MLFCGAGFSADCLNFKPDDTLGTGSQLLQLFNAKLTELNGQSGFKKLQNASDALKKELGENGLMNLLKERFDVTSVSDEMVDILRFPWQAVYTTNYDNGIEVAALRAKKKYDSLNNLVDVTQIPNRPFICHLHGAAAEWTIHNFDQSCILGADSYLRLRSLDPWLERLRQDLNHAQFVAFVGFSASDFHINEAVYNLSDLKEKAFFINRPSAEQDQDVHADQSRLGTPFYFGRNGFAEHIRKRLSETAPREPQLSSFYRFESPTPADEIPSVAEDIEKLYLFGRINKNQLARDIQNGTSDYHIFRSTAGLTRELIKDGKKVILFSGYPCDGKTMLIEGLAIEMGRTRPVFILRHPYDDLLNEVSDILVYAPTCLMIIENCMDLRPERLAAIAKQFEGEDRVLLMSSRAIAVDAEQGALSELRKMQHFHNLPLPRLDEREAEALANRVDQFAGWLGFRDKGQSAQKRFILEDCKASIAHFLMKLLNSEHVKNRYKEEFSKFSFSETQWEVIIGSLYCSHVGHDAPVEFLSELLQDDVTGLVRAMERGASGNASFDILRLERGKVKTVPSIGATNTLNGIVDNQRLIRSIGSMTRTLSNKRRGEFEQRIFSQMMRYTRIQSIITLDGQTDRAQVDRFFDHLSSEQSIRRMPLFWLQWHIAKSDAKEFVDAGRYLDRGYQEAEELGKRTGKKFRTIQLDDRKAKFLMDRAAYVERSAGDLFRDFKDACEITTRLLNGDSPQHYPFETLQRVTETLPKVQHRLSDPHVDLVNGWIESL